MPRASRSGLHRAAPRRCRWTSSRRRRRYQAGRYHASPRRRSPLRAGRPPRRSAGLAAEPHQSRPRRPLRRPPPPSASPAAAPKRPRPRLALLRPPLSWPPASQREGVSEARRCSWAGLLGRRARLLLLRLLLLQRLQLGLPLLPKLRHPRLLFSAAALCLGLLTLRAAAALCLLLTLSLASPLFVRRRLAPAHLGSVAGLPGAATRGQGRVGEPTTTTERAGAVGGTASRQQLVDRYDQSERCSAERRRRHVFVLRAMC